MVPIAANSMTVTAGKSSNGASAALASNEGRGIVDTLQYTARQISCIELGRDEAQCMRCNARTISASMEAVTKPLARERSCMATRASEVAGLQRFQGGDDYLAAELKDTGIKVSLADPGFTATDLNEHRGYQTVLKGAAAAIRLVLLPDYGSIGGFFRGNEREPW